MQDTTTALDFYIETRRRKSWRRYYEPVTDLYAARQAAARLAELPGVDTRVTDSDGQVWA